MKKRLNYKILIVYLFFLMTIPGFCENFIIRDPFSNEINLNYKNLSLKPEHSSLSKKIDSSWDFENTSQNLKNDINSQKVNIKGSNLESKTAYAIVIGISNYPGYDYDLSYCDDDSQDVYSMLINDYNFKTENVIYLQDSSASKSAISNALDNIGSKIDENDIFFFYYSGHGGAGTSNAGTYYESIDSPHPYPEYYDQTWNIYHSNAVKIRVHFDRFELESNYDYVYLGDTDLNYGWYYYDYTGYMGSFWSGWVPLLDDNRVYIRMVSDLSINEWGFSIDRYEVETYDGTHYLCSYDSIPDNSDNYYIDDLLNSKLDSFVTQEKYVILDSCHSGGFIPEVQKTGRYIMTACEADEYSLEDPSLGHGVFTNYFLESKSSATDTNGDGLISFEEMYDYTRAHTISESSDIGYTHHPCESDGITGESILTTNFGSISLIPINNSLSYSFNLYGTGLINELKIIALGNFESQNVNISDLTSNPISDTGFGEYSGNITLKNATRILSYGIYANISGNHEIILTETVSNDTDSDSLDDFYEINNGLDPFCNDTDSDGLLDGIELSYSTNPNNNDTDDDGILDGTEVYIYQTNPIIFDTDGDLLSDFEELFIFNTSAVEIDTENDGMDDYFEVINGLNPILDDANLDADNDLLSNLLEFQISSNPNSNDSDNDSIDDYYEYCNDLDINCDDTSLDCDGDGLSNGLEYSLGSLSNNIDSDNDGMPDGYEYNNGLSLTTDDSLEDADSDNLQNILEYFLSTDPNDADTDDDGLTDGAEKLVYSTDPLKPDTDGDGYNDGLEISMGTSPLDPKFSINTIVLNISGAIILGISGIYTIYRYKKNLNLNRDEKPKKSQFKLKLNPPEFEALKTIKIDKPKPKPRIQLSPSRPVESRIYRTPINKNVLETSFDMLKDVLRNRLPSPNPINSNKGMNAMLLAAKAQELQEKGKILESYEYLIKSLIMGVPEPFNTRIKTHLLQIIEENEKESATTPNLHLQREESVINKIQCENCQHNNELKAKFCTNCGKPLNRGISLKTEEEQLNKHKVCKNCQYKNPKDFKFCLNCGEEL